MSVRRGGLRRAFRVGTEFTMELRLGFEAGLTAEVNQPRAIQFELRLDF